MAEARALKLCTKGDYMSGQRDDKSPLKGAWFFSRPIFVCATVDLEKISPPHAASWDQ